MLKTGFYMLQESVYCKLVLNQSAAASVLEGLRKYKPETGVVEVMTITEKQFSNIEVLTGKHKTSMIESDERLVIL